MSVPTESEDDPFLKALWDEYELAQGKIDHIGEFKFRVKGWSLTLQTALIAALLSGKADWVFNGWIPATIIAAALCVIFLFHTLDQQQNDLSNALGRRAKEIEKILDLSVACGRPTCDPRKRKMLDAHLAAFSGTPRLAHMIALASQRPLKAFFRGMFNIRSNAFYLSQYLLTALMISVIWWAYLSNKASETAKAPADLASAQEQHPK